LNVSVIAGLDPAIHHCSKAINFLLMAARVKPGHDERSRNFTHDNQV